MTTSSGSVPTTQPCPSCRALVYYEGHSELRGPLVPHRFHCHSCGTAFIVRSTSHKPPKFALSMRHAVQGEVEHDHDHEEEAAGPTLESLTTVPAAENPPPATPQPPAPQP